MLAASSGCVMTSPMRGGRPLGKKTRVVDGKRLSFSALPSVWSWSNFEITEAVLGELDRGLEDVAETHRAIAFQRGRPALEGPGHDRRLVPGFEVVERHGARRRGGGRPAERVEPDHAVLLRQVDHHESAEAADPRHVGLGDVQRSRGGHDRVDGVASLHQDRRARKRCVERRDGGSRYLRRERRRR